MLVTLPTAPVEDPESVVSPCPHTPSDKLWSAISPGSLLQLEVITPGHSSLPLVAEDVPGTLMGVAGAKLTGKPGRLPVASLSFHPPATLLLSLSPSEDQVGELADTWLWCLLVPPSDLTFTHARYVCLLI